MAVALLTEMEIL